MSHIAPSILAADFTQLGRDVDAVRDAGAKYLHLDVMDGHFVPNITLGAPIVKCMRPRSDLVFDVHLMISDPKKYIPDFIKAGARVDQQHRPVEHKSAQQRQGDRDSPHTHRQGIHVEQRIPAASIRLWNAMGSVSFFSFP